MRRAIIIVAAIAVIGLLVRWWLRWQEARHTPAEDARYSDVARDDKAKGKGSGGVDLDDLIAGG